MERPAVSEQSTEEQRIQPEMRGQEQVARGVVPEGTNAEREDEGQDRRPVGEQPAKRVGPWPEARERPKREGECQVEVLLDGKRPRMVPDEAEIVLNEERLGEVEPLGDDATKPEPSDEEQEIESRIDLEPSSAQEPQRPYPAVTTVLLEE